MDADLYATLGVDRSASREEIARAGRRKAREAHPDKGGSEEAWHALALAREVLGDDAKRARYDATGEIPQPQRSIEDEARAELMAAWVELVRSGGLGRRMDVADHLRKGLRRLQKKCREAIRENEVLVERISTQIGRLTGAEAVYFEGYLQEQVRAARATIEEENRGILIAEQACEMIADLKDLHAPSEDRDPVADAIREMQRQANPFKVTW